MLYNIINPSDPYTIDYDDEAVISASMLILGQGQLGVTNIETDDTILPLFFGNDPFKWFEETHNENLSDFIDVNRLRIAECLESVLYSRDQSSRDEYFEKYNSLETVEEKLAWRDKWQDQRSSLNDIGNNAYDLAGRIRVDISDSDK